MEPDDGVTCNLNCKKIRLSGKNSAFLAAFSGGVLKEDDAKNIQYRAYENSQTPDGLDRKRTRKILVVDTGKLQYRGLNYGIQASQRGELSRYFVGVRNKKSGVMTVHGIQLVHCIPLLNTNADAMEDENDNQQEKTFVEKMDLLTSAFGSKRKRQAMESRLNDAGKDCDGAAIADSVELHDLKELKISGSEISSPQTAQAIPPQNASAATPDQVYDLKDIISVEEHFALEPLAQDLIDATPEQIQQWKNESTYGQLVLQNLQNSRSSLDLDKAKLLLYYNFILQLLKLIAKDIRRKDPLPNIPDPFKRKLLENFTLSGSTQYGTHTRNMPLSMKDKAMSYALVLALFIEDFRVELPVLQSDFKKGQPALIRIANAVGCSIINQKKNNVPVKIAELKLPLFVLSSRTFRKMKR